MTECTCQTVSDDYSDHMHESASQPECPVYTAGKEARMAAMTDEERTLAEVRREIAKMPEDDQIRVQVIAMTLRNILKADQHAPMALVLVGAEMAAQP